MGQLTVANCRALTDNQCRLQLIARIQQVVASEDINKKIESDLEKELEERKKKNMEAHLKKSKSKKNDEIVDV